MDVTGSIKRDYKAEYRAWVNMLHRCYNEEHRAYGNYGGRGLTVCDDWRDAASGFKTFLTDMGTRCDGQSLDRIDNERGYSKANCRWTDRKTQQNNRRPNSWYQLDFGLGHYARSPFIRYHNRTQTLKVWAEELGINPSTIRQRLKAGWSVAKAFGPVSRSNPRRNRSQIYLINNNKKG